MRMLCLALILVSLPLLAEDAKKTTLFGKTEKLVVEMVYANERLKIYPYTKEMTPINIVDLNLVDSKLILPGKKPQKMTLLNKKNHWLYLKKIDKDVKEFRVELTFEKDKERQTMKFTMKQK